MNNYTAIKSKASDLGLPLRFDTDLTEHDRLVCARIGQKRSFLWGVYESGTHMIVSGDSVGTAMQYRGIDYFKSFFSEFNCKWFGWDGFTLQELTSDEEAAAWIDSQKTAK